MEPFRYLDVGDKLRSGDLQLVRREHPYGVVNEFLSIQDWQHDDKVSVSKMFCRPIWSDIVETAGKLVSEEDPEIIDDLWLRLRSLTEKRNNELLARKGGT